MDALHFLRPPPPRNSERFQMETGSRHMDGWRYGKERALMFSFSSLFLSLSLSSPKIIIILEKDLLCVCVYIGYLKRYFCLLAVPFRVGGEYVCVCVRVCVSVIVRQHNIWTQSFFFPPSYGDDSRILR